MHGPDRSFLCIRHGVTDWNVRGVFQGRTNVPLNEAGLAQARSVALNLKADPPGCIVTSPLLRASQTAEIIGSEFGVTLAIDERLSECDFGSFEGLNIADVMGQHGITERSALASILPADAEPWQNVSRRALRSIRHWLDRYRKRTVLFVSHDAVMQSIAERLCGHWFDNQHGMPYRFERGASRWTVRAVEGTKTLSP